MTSTGKIVMGVLIVIVLTAGGFLVYDAVLGETEAASGPISAAPIAIEAPTENPYPVELNPQATESLTAGESGPYPVETEASEDAVPVVFAIVPEESEARFVLGEILRGQPKTVVGLTDQVAGELAVDLTDLATAQVGEVRVNARTLVTDSEQRNRAIRNQILVTDSYEFITFTPTSVSGLVGSAGVADTFTFQIEGELTIRDVTQPVVFDVTATLVSEDRIEGTASTVIARGNYGLTIPSVPSVAGVDEDVTLEIDFVARVK